MSDIAIKLFKGTHLIYVGQNFDKYDRQTASDEFCHIIENEFVKIAEDMIDKTWPEWDDKIMFFERV